MNIPNITYFSNEDFMFPHLQSASGYTQMEQQNQRHQIARTRQVIYELEQHTANIHGQLTYLDTNLTPENALDYTNLLPKFRSSFDELQNYKNNLVALMSMMPIEFSKTISEQCKREIYHLYHAGRYTQNELANHYGISQSAVSKIVNGEPPSPLLGVNPQGISG